MVDARSGRSYFEHMPFPGARRLQEVEPFLAMEVLERALALEREGAPVLHLEVGEPDFPAPQPVIDACQQALRDGETHYTDSRGLLPLREAISRNLGERFGVAPDPDRVLVTMGTSPAMLLTFQTLLDPGDEVILTPLNAPVAGLRVNKVNSKASEK